MTTYIALFRGINVGRNRSLPMQSLKTILEQLGCRQVKTYIQSGNVVFQHAELDRARFCSIFDVQRKTGPLPDTAVPGGCPVNIVRH